MEEQLDYVLAKTEVLEEKIEMLEKDRKRVGGDNFYIKEETPSLKIINKHFKINFDMVKTLDDVILILKAMNISCHWYQETCPEQFQEIYNKGLLIEELKND